MKQAEIFHGPPSSENSNHALDNSLFFKFIGDANNQAALYNKETLIKRIDLSDKVARKLFIVEAVELGANQTRLAKLLNISRQTIHNYMETKKRFGLEGLIHHYSPSRSKSRRKQRQIHADKLPTGNIARKLEQIRKQEREARPKQLEIDFYSKAANVPSQDQPYHEEHDWEFSRYAGVFPYLITLITQNDWLRMIMDFFGGNYKIFMVFLLMTARNVRSIEQLKNVRNREAARILGIRRFPSKLKARIWLHAASIMYQSKQLLSYFFSRQLRTGIVGLWLWFTDGHLLPYTGKNKVHPGYHTQRRMMVPGRTNLVTSDSSGRIVDFEIQEGKGSLREHVLLLKNKWKQECPESPIMVFDREGYGADFFYEMIQSQTFFVTWEKYVDPKELAALEDALFVEEFECNEKKYRVFEKEKKFSHTLKDKKCQQFALRRIYIWNVTSKRRTCALAWVESEKMSAKDCALAILNRWGASENTFKHIIDRHPFHYQPGFRFVKSEKQEIINPECKEKKGSLSRKKTQLQKLYKSFSKSEEVLNRDGTVRQNSKYQRLKNEIQSQENEIHQLSREIKQLPEKIDLSMLEDYKCFQRVCNESKNLFDFVTSSVWNARKQMTEWLFPYYENINEYIDLFYTITECQGWIKTEKHSVTVRIEPLEQPSRRIAQEQFCRKLTSLKAMAPNGKILKIEVGVAQTKY